MEKSAAPARPGKGAWLVTWLAFAAGIAASVAANIAHAEPTAGARFVAGWAPVALLLTIEVMMRVPAPRNRVLAGLRYLGTVVVAGVAALASYRHMKGLALEYGEDQQTAATLPLSVDGLVVVASIALLVLADERRAAVAAERAAADPPHVPMSAPEVEAVQSPLPPNQAPGTKPLPMDTESPAVAGLEAASLPTATERDLVPPAVANPEQLPLPAATERDLVSPAVANPEQVPLPSAAVVDSLPLPSLEPIMPPEPWPRQDGDGERLPFDFGAKLSRLDAATRQLYQQAYRRYLESVAAGTPLVGRELGPLCGRSERWGRDRITEARAAQQRTAEPKELAAVAAGGR